MANAMFGSGVTVVGASYTGPRDSSAVFTNGQLAPGVLASSTGVILSTGDVRDFTQSSGDPNRSASTSTDTAGVDNNSQFNAIAGARTFDAVWIDVDFIPTGDFLSMRFVFSSEEYPEYVNSNFNDVMGVWINGAYVPVSIGNGTSSINNINPLTQPNLFVNNTADAFNTEMDGFTVTLTLTIPVRSGVVNSIRIGIADTSDAQYDSNLIIMGDSLQTTLVARDDVGTMFATGEKTFNVLANDIYQGSGTLRISQINGINVVAGQVITLPSGQRVRLNADGTITVIGNGDIEQVNFTYTVVSSLGGHIDTGLIKITTIPCFVAGTMILTENGECPVERLRAGDMVMTKDDGPQPLRWIGRRLVPALGALAPIEIRAGTFGDHRRLLVSPQHRVLVRDAVAELLFGETEVLVSAKDLVNGKSVRVIEGGEVEYVHLLFDKHQIISSEGLATESFLPGPQSTRMFEAEIIDEICTLFPELNPKTGDGYSPAVRRTLRPFEAQLLFAAAEKAA
ncbi:Hint domain-containing protein [Rhodobacter sp. ETT8]|uniref:Hint domain-containing protein n=2 Tax=Pseudotabrizicola algicola TaxID=2709381 RepID=A0A6B3RQG8_9RHOB|nr:Hint domain-containing protein [Pseudotabrizicola algicola]NEX46245.1 Hint domain-containing protein [Pseudotabrizicola algicola]